MSIAMSPNQRNHHALAITKHWAIGLIFKIRAQSGEYCPSVRGGCGNAWHHVVHHSSNISVRQSLVSLFFFLGSTLKGTVEAKADSSRLRNSDYMQNIRSTSVGTRRSAAKTIRNPSTDRTMALNHANTFSPGLGGVPANGVLV